jgi:uncharacterized protein YjaZ
MRLKNLTKIQFCFPEKSDFKSSDYFLDALIELSVEEPTNNGHERWGGFWEPSSLKDSLERKLGEDRYMKYRSITKTQKDEIEKVIQAAADTCQKALPTPEPPMRIFVYPWFSNEAVFEGTMGTNFWQNTFHLYINTSEFTIESLREVVAHEYNHAIFSNNDFKRTILQPIVMEGLAEHFREDVMGGSSAPWGVALDHNEAAEKLTEIKEKNQLYVTLGDSKKEYEAYGNLYDKIFFGDSDEYPRWTGYSIGYRLISAYRKKHSDTSWEDLTQTDPETILAESGFVK